MGALTFVGRIVLVVLNILFILVSLAIVCGGFVLRFGNEHLDSLFNDTLSKITAGAGDIYGDTGFSMDDFDYSSLVAEISIVMIVLGVVLLAISLVGWISACCNVNTLALVYAIILIVILLPQIVMVAIVYGSPDTLKDYMRESMNKMLEDYEGLRGTSMKTMGMNFGMQRYGCCGVDDYNDFTGRGTWLDAANDGALTTNLITPVACCMTIPSSPLDVTSCAGDTSDTSLDEGSEIEALSNLNNGCADVIWKAVIEDNNAAFLPVIAICLGFQLVLIIFAILIFRNKGVKGGAV